MLKNTKPKKQENIFFKKIEKVIEQHQEIVILGHINPDGDCIGSQIALYYSLKQKYPDKKIYFPFAKTQYSNFLLPKNYENEIQDVLLEKALIIVVDLNAPQRLNIKLSKTNFVVVIDHHIKTDVTFGDLNWINPKVSSCCEMIYLLIKNLKWPMDKNIASALLLGIITDSGNFKYANVNNLTFETAAQLLKEGAELQKIHHHLTTKKLIDLKIQSYCFNNFIKKKKLLYFAFAEKDMKKTPYLKEIKDPFAEKIQLFSFLEGIKVWAFFIQMKKTELIKVSLRCVPELNVFEIAKKYGGGGHKNAAGIKLKNWNDVNEIIKELDELSNKKTTKKDDFIKSLEK